MNKKSNNKFLISLILRIIGFTVIYINTSIAIDKYGTGIGGVLILIVVGGSILMLADEITRM